MRPDRESRPEEIDRLRESILVSLGEQSTTLQNLDALKRRIEDIQLEVEKVTSEIEAADTVEVILTM